MKINASSNEHSALIEKLKESNLRRAIIEKLLFLCENLDAMNEDVEAQRYVAAALRIHPITERFDDSVCSCESELMALQILSERFAIQVDELKQQVLASWKQCVVVTSCFDEVNKVTTAQLKSSADRKDMLGDMCQALYNLGLLHEHVAVLGTKLMKHFFKPSLTSNKISFGASTQKDSKSQVFTLRYPSTNDESGVVTPSDAFERLTAILNFLSTDVFSGVELELGSSGEKRMLMSFLGESCSDELQQLLVDECLTRAVPLNHNELPSFNDVISATKNFHAYLQSLHFIESDSSATIAYVSDVDVHFAKKKCQQVLTQARSLMQRELHNTVRVSSTHPFSELPALKIPKTDDPVLMPDSSVLDATVFRMPEFSIR